MSFDEEWANLKAEALARQSAGMQLNQLPADAGGSPGGVSADGTLDYNSASINGNANLLIEIAGFLHEGRPDGDLCTLARDPRSHSDVAAQRRGRTGRNLHRVRISGTAQSGERIRRRPGG
ncbi:hypothetical protein ABZX28_18335 [Streptomyces rubiginosohelvolus]|uniref:hypothetical protein n=1 Tax=Streptomyces rubiginosohelvolus TaxID=67362 RepID=UPI0033B74B1F